MSPRTTMLSLLAVAVLLVSALPRAESSTLTSPDGVAAGTDHGKAATHAPLPHWPVGPDGKNATPAPDPARPLTPYALTAPPQFAGAPDACLIESPPEYAPVAGLLLRYRAGGWHDVVTDLVANLTGDPTDDEIAYVVVSNISQQQHAQSSFTNAGADLSKVRFTTQPNDSIWIRDYGPLFIWQGGASASVDGKYYSGRPLDNFIPTELADDLFVQPSYHLDLNHPGGNFQAASDRSGFVTSLIVDSNRPHGEPALAELLRAYQGIDTLHVMPRLPSSVDATGHIDMWFYLVDADTVIIAEFLPGSNATAIQVTNNAVPYMESLGYEVVRVPAFNAFHPGYGNAHYTYTNAVRVNDRIFIPSYGDGNAAYDQYDDEALAAWQQAAGSGVEIVQIDGYDIVWAAGVLHCITMQVPRYTDSLPSVCTTSPGSGELLVAGATHEITWAASDDGTVETVDLYYSTDGGQTYPPEQVIATGLADDGAHTWTVPNVEATSARMRTVMHDDHGNVVESENGEFPIVTAAQHIYDFGTGAGVDRWGWSWRNQVSNWDDVDGVRRPTSGISELTASEYARIAASDATGGAGDTDRYFPSGSIYGRSTHVFEFVIAEDPAEMLDIAIRWEGFADDCTQVELYVWDDVANQWCDGRGRYGEDQHMANFGGNRDQALKAHIREQFDRYVDGSGMLTVLVYGDYAADQIYHDYVSVTVTYEPCTGDLDGSGAVDFADLTSLLAAWGSCVPSPACASDFDGNGMVGFGDLTALLANWGPCS